MAVKPIPEGYRTITPYLTVTGVKQVLDFVTKAFDAKQPYPPMTQPDGTIMHAEVEIGDSRVMMGEANPKWPAMPSILYLYVPDVDAWYRRALDAGGQSFQEPANQFYGDRTAGVRDTGGNLWFLATHMEDVAPDEMARRAADAARQGAAG